MAKTISISIPCYNSERYIRTTIESALGQTVAADEILISDDRSPDRSWEIIQEYEGLPRVRILRPPERTSLGGHYRFLLEQSASDYICFLSSDDALMPNFIATMHRQLESEENRGDNIGLITSACLETNSRLVPLKTRGTGTPQRSIDPPKGFDYMTEGCIYTISFSLLSRRILIDMPPIPAAADLATDWCWALLLSAQGKIKFVHELMGYYRIHSTHAGHNRDKEWQEATVVMLEFVRNVLGPELGEKLQPWLTTTYGQIEDRRAGRREPPAQPTLKARLKSLAKSAIAVRYRKLPACILKAEQGIGIALEAFRSSR
jgi:glycosyltransferase involved in cell wall biosynthesis